MSIVYNLSNEQYHLDPSISSSAVKTVVQKSLAHWKYGERKPNVAFDLGTSVHTLVLEPHLASTVRCGPETRRGKEWKEAYEAAEAEGCVLLTEGDYRLAVDMAQAVRANPAAAQLLGGNLTAEPSIFARDEIHGLNLRCRPDGWRKDIAAVIDLKTTVDASPEGFAKQVANLGYHVQEAFYRKTMLLSDIEIDRFVFVAVEKEPPFAVGVYELDWRSLDEGKAAVEYGLELISKAQKAGDYGTGYGDLKTLQIPNWAFRFTKT